MNLSAEHSYGTPPTEVKEEILRLLTSESGLDINPDFKESLFNYIDKRFKRLGTCVLWSRSKEFSDLAYRFGLEIGLKEIVIYENYNIGFSENYKMPPKQAVN